MGRLMLTITVIGAAAGLSFAEAGQLPHKPTLTNPVHLMHHQVQNVVATPNPLTSRAIEARIGALTRKQSNVKSSNEMTVMQLQSAMQSRSQILQAGSNMLSSKHDAQKTIVGNLR